MINLILKSVRYKRVFVNNRVCFKRVSPWQELCLKIGSSENADFKNQRRNFAPALDEQT